MNSFLMLSCSIMLVILLFGQVYEATQIKNTDISDGTYTFDEQTGEWTVNGTATTYNVGEQNLILGISLNEGIMIAVIAVVALITIVGTSVLTFDISETAEKAIVNFSIYGALWGIFSTLMFTQLISITFLGLGWFIFLIISIIHFFGILKIIYPSG